MKTVGNIKYITKDEPELAAWLKRVQKEIDKKIKAENEKETF